MDLYERIRKYSIDYENEEAENHVLMPNEVKALPLNSRVCIEFRLEGAIDSLFVTHEMIYTPSLGQRLYARETGSLSMADIVGCDYNRLFRVWALGQPPTDKEMESNPWSTKSK